MAAVMCHKEKIIKEVDTQTAFSELNPLGHCMVLKSHHKYWNNATSVWIQHLTTPLYHLGIRLVESRALRRCIYNHPELVTFFEPGISFQVELCKYHHMLKHPEIKYINRLRFDHSRWRGAFHIHEQTFSGSNC
jgi:hypothetical protein